MSGEHFSLAARLAQNQVGRDPALAAATLSEVQSDAKRALAELRELATGIDPPLWPTGAS